MFGKGSFISEHFSVWLKSPQKWCQITTFFLEIGAKMKNFLRLSQLQLNLFCMKMNLDLCMAYSAVSLTHIQNAQAISFFESWLQFSYLSWLLEYQWRIIYKILSYILDVLWGQPIKLIQVASNLELHENQWNDLLFFKIVPSHWFGASKVQT